MRTGAVLCVAACCALGSGCSLPVDVESNVGVPGCVCVEGTQDSLCGRKIADEAWEATRAAHPDLTCSADYARGFKEGFAEHLPDAGTEESPPGVATERRYPPPEDRAGADWAAGFRHGAAVARQSKCSRFVTVLVVLKDIPQAPAAPAPAPLPQAVPVLPLALPPALPPAQGQRPAVRELPPPRPIASGRREAKSRQTPGPSGSVLVLPELRAGPDLPPPRAELGRPLAGVETKPAPPPTYVVANPLPGNLAPPTSAVPPAPPSLPALSGSGWRDASPILPRRAH